jgi:hypothetical protein
MKAKHVGFGLGFRLEPNRGRCSTFGRGASASEAGHEKKVDAGGGVGRPMLTAAGSPRGPEGFDKASGDTTTQSFPAQNAKPDCHDIIKAARRAIGSFRFGSPSEKRALTGSEQLYRSSSVRRTTLEWTLAIAATNDKQSSRLLKNLWRERR